MSSSSRASLPGRSPLRTVLPPRATVSIAGRGATHSGPRRGGCRRFAIDGQSDHETARELRISPATVGVHVLRARRKLRERLGARHAPQRRIPGT